jgi:hypothetical protein
VARCSCIGKNNFTMEIFGLLIMKSFKLKRGRAYVRFMLRVFELLFAAGYIMCVYKFLFLAKEKYKQGH